MAEATPRKAGYLHVAHDSGSWGWDGVFIGSVSRWFVWKDAVVQQSTDSEEINDDDGDKKNWTKMGVLHLVFLPEDAWSLLVCPVVGEDFCGLGGTG